MSDTVIRVENLGKKYIIGHQNPGGYKSLRDVMANSAKSLRRRLVKPLGKKLSDQTVEEFWALKDVSFEIKKGDCVGIIGRNGAGKSTLLKILSRITEPTSGRITVKGRVASLLEVGTGFHPELTGRENIFLNGAILGMSRFEIKKKFDEIVAFAEVEKFLDTPVKHYSSGMYVRLAFAVAAHLEPEILVVDEVLAVGDAQFQQKCLGKMENVARGGRTILFVSHNMSTIQKLCSYGIYLKSGHVEYEGNMSQVLNKYLSDVKENSKFCPLRERKDRQGTGGVKIIKFYILDKLGREQHILSSGEDYRFVMEYEKSSSCEKLSNVVVSIAITDSRNEIIFLVRSNFTNQNLSLSKDKGRIECYVKDFSLATGSYSSTLFLSHGEAEVLDWIEDASGIIVEGGDFFGTGSIGLPSHCRVLTRADWRTG
jgi:lipopolysaccharide transport system ATP-binding protein